MRYWQYTEFMYTGNIFRQTVGSCVSQKRENLRFSTCLTLLRTYSIYLVNRQERSSLKSSFSVFWQKGNFKKYFICPGTIRVPIHQVPRNNGLLSRSKLSLVFHENEIILTFGGSSTAKKNVVETYKT